MWGKQNKVWIKYRSNIIATDVTTAIFLSGYLKYSSLHKSYVNKMEVLDLQRYKLITRPNKVKAALNDRLDIPFVFAICKN